MEGIFAEKNVMPTILFEVWLCKITKGPNICNWHQTENRSIWVLYQQSMSHTELGLFPDCKSSECSTNGLCPTVSWDWSQTECKSSECSTNRLCPTLSWDWSQAECKSSECSTNRLCPTLSWDWSQTECKSSECSTNRLCPTLSWDWSQTV